MNVDQMNQIQNDIRAGLDQGALRLVEQDGQQYILTNDGGMIRPEIAQQLDLSDYTSLNVGGQNNQLNPVGPGNLGPAPIGNNYQMTG